MRCREMDELLNARFVHPGAAPPGPAAEHLAECPRCRRLWDVLDRAPRSESAPPQVPLPDRIEPVRRLPPASVRVLLLLLIFLLPTAGGLVFFRASAVSKMTPAQTAAAGLVLLAATVLAAIAVSQQMEPGTARLIPVAWLVAGVFAALVVVVTVLFPWERSSMRFGALCLGIGGFLALPAALLTWILARRGAVLAPVSACAAAGLLAGLAGATVLQFGCAQFDLMHQACHSAVPFTGAAAGLLIGRFSKSA